MLKCSMVSRKSSSIAVARQQVRDLIKSQLINIMRATPSLSRFYRQTLRSDFANSPELKMLAEKYFNFRDSE
jgi:hypothetical protein